MKISLGSDHAGFLYKEKVKELLGSLGHEVKDFGTFSEEPVDYPLFIRPAAEAVARGECERGIVFGGSGNGEAMVANKVHGVRSAFSTTQRRQCSFHWRTPDPRGSGAKHRAHLAGNRFRWRAARETRRDAERDVISFNRSGRLNRRQPRKRRW